VQDGEVDELMTPVVNRPVTEARSPDSRAAEANARANASTRSLDLPPRLTADANFTAAKANLAATGLNAVSAGPGLATAEANLATTEASLAGADVNSAAVEANPGGAGPNLVGRATLLAADGSLVAEDGPPVSAGAEERRRHPRAPVELLVGLKFDSVQHFLAMYAEDISESGMFLRSEHAGALRSMGEELELSFDAGNRRIVQGRGRVVRMIGPGDPTSSPGIAIEFVELDDTSRKLVEAIVRIKLASVRTG
jgi:PilZ domain-containing protein